MNRTDLFTRTAIDVINPLTLTEFVSKVVASGPIAAAPVIIEATYEHVITPRYELIPTTLGVTGRTLSGSTSEMTWIEIASLLANVATTEWVGTLRHAIEPDGWKHTIGADHHSTRRAVEDFVHAAAVAGGLLDPPMQLEVDNGFDLQLRSTRHRATLLINDVELFDVRPHDFTAHVGVRAHTDPRTGVDVAGFDAMVVFVPHGDSNTPTATSAADRIGAVRLDPDSDVGAQWAVQIDGYDTVVVEAFPETGVRVAVYDSNPDEKFLRFDKSFPIEPIPPLVEHRLARVTFPLQGRAL
jgi:hypothetical protein